MKVSVEMGFNSSLDVVDELHGGVVDVTVRFQRERVEVMSRCVHDLLVGFIFADRVNAGVVAGFAFLAADDDVDGGWWLRVCSDVRALSRVRVAIESWFDRDFDSVFL